MNMEVDKPEVHFQEMESFDWAKDSAEMQESRRQDVEMVNVSNKLPRQSPEYRKWALAPTDVKVEEHVKYMVAQAFDGWGTAVAIKDEFMAMDRQKLIPSPIGIIIGYDGEITVGSTIKVLSFKVNVTNKMNLEKRKRFCNLSEAPAVFNGSLSFILVADEMELVQKSNCVERELARVIRSYQVIGRSSTIKLSAMVVNSTMNDKIEFGNNQIEETLDFPMKVTQWYETEILTISNKIIVIMNGGYVIGILPGNYECFETEVSWKQTGIKFRKVEKPSELANGGAVPLRLLMPNNQKLESIYRARLLNIVENAEGVSCELKQVRLPAAKIANVDRISNKTNSHPTVVAKFESFDMDGKLQLTLQPLDIVMNNKWLCKGKAVNIEFSEARSCNFIIANVQANMILLCRTHESLEMEEVKAINRMARNQGMTGWEQWEYNELKYLEDFVGQNCEVVTFEQTQNEITVLNSMRSLSMALNYPMIRTNTYWSANEEQTLPYKIISGLPVKFQPLPKKRLEAVTNNKILNEEQKCSIDALLSNEEACVLQMAPAGTGKTKVLAEMLTILPNEGVKTIMLTALTNEAVMNLVEAVLKAGIPNEDVLVVKSIYALYDRMSDDGVLNKNDPYSPISRLLPIYEKNPKLINYKAGMALRIYKAHPSVELNVVTLAAAAFELMNKERRIIIATTFMARNILRKLKCSLDLLAIDEAGQVSSTEALAIFNNCRYPIKKLFVTGDVKQLQTYVPHNQPELHEFGLASLLDTTNNHPATIKTQLRVSYRFNPLLCIGLSNAIYDGQLMPGVQLEDRMAMMNYEGAARNLPVVFVDVDGKETKEETSYYNDHQNDAVKAILRKIYQNGPMPNGRRPTVAIITFYLSNAQHLGPIVSEAKARFSMGQDVPILTVDGCQGRERDIIIIVTVRTDCNAVFDFCMHPQRSTVALTRARHGFFIVGHRPYIEKNNGPFGKLVRTLQ